MAKTYDFRITLRRATFEKGMVSVPFGATADVYTEICPHCTLAEALEQRQKLSDAETRSHVATLTMKYRDVRKAPGISKVFRLNGERHAKT